MDVVREGMKVVGGWMRGWVGEWLDGRMCGWMVQLMN